MADLWRYYDEHAAQARQHENLRATVTSILTGFAAVLVGIAGTGGLNHSDIPAGLVVIAIGLLGALLSLKHYERNRFHTKVMSAVRTEIGTLRGETGEPATSTAREAGNNEHEAKFPKDVKAGMWIVRLSLYQLWVALDLMVAVAGAVIVVGSLS